MQILNSYVLFTIVIATNLVALSLLPLTAGFTRLMPTAACIVSVIVQFWILSKLIHGGIELGVLIPLLAALLPFATIFIGIFLYGESFSIMKITLLFVACILIGIAALDRY